MHPTVSAETRARWRQMPLEAAIREAVLRSDGSIGGLAEAAERLCFSPRTLRRRLRDCGYTYRSLTESIRRQRCMVLLEHERTLEAVAANAGYSSTANLIRAFRRWSGTTPGAYRGERRVVSTAYGEI